MFKKDGKSILLSPSDLVNHLGCSHLTKLNQGVAEGIIDKPEYFDPNAEVLKARGLAFEQSYLTKLREEGYTLTIPTEGDDRSGYERTISDMRSGLDFIYQARLQMDEWSGTADFLKRIEKPSRLGTWSYEVIDTKLARETKSGAILQLCLYSQCIEHIQGNLPDYMHVVTPDEEGFKSSSYRIHDYLAYHRLMMRRLKEQLISDQENYPEPVEHCDICKWWQVCDKRRRTDDHLSLVAGISRSQRAEAVSQGINSTAALSTLPLPLAWKPSRGAKESYVKIREQARIQIESRSKGEILFELLPLQGPIENKTGTEIIRTGLYRLPLPTPGDVFLDFEGDPYVGSSGLEYLTGWIEIESGRPEYHAIWSFDAKAEKAAFENFNDRVFQKLQAYPDLHIYHYGHYEPSALKRLMSRYATRERELDWFLRGKRFIDLHSISRQTMRAGVEHYSLKNLEPLFGYQRKTDLREASLAKRKVEHLLELHQFVDEQDADSRTTLSYNREDCESAYHLRHWLESLREQCVRDGTEIMRPEVKSGDASDNQEIRNEELAILFNRLTEEVPLEYDERNDEQQARWMLAHLLDYHWRERKVKLWEKFRLQELPEEEMIDDKSALGGLKFNRRISTDPRSVVDEYQFEPQDTELRSFVNVTNKEKSLRGSVLDIQPDAGIITLKKSAKYQDIHPLSIYNDEIINNNVLHQAIKRIAEWVADNGIEGQGEFKALRDLLIRHEPVPSFDQIKPHDDLKDFACEWSSQLDESVLPVQGPPSSGKTFTGAHIILKLVQQGKKVGVTAMSHKVIETLLENVSEEATKIRMDVRIGHKIKEGSVGHHATIKSYDDNAKPLADLQSGDIDVVGGTSYMWSRPEYQYSVDVLIVDEAGQLSLADTLAAGQSAKSLILIGDPQQLKQPQQGSHPEGTEVSSLEHISGGHQTIPPEKGVFIDQTRRMHPSVCSYIGELFYEGKLRSFSGMENQVLNGHPYIKGAGLLYEPVDHNGNQNASKEEAVRVAEIVNDLTNGNVFWTDKEGNRRDLRLNDILIITPYNAQVAAIRTLLPESRVGTVDKFQGQEAPVVIYSMASSSPEDAPRGMDFLYNPNRLNVAISRAKTAAIIVANPNLFSPDCRTPAQMKMANAFCRYLEMAKIDQ